MDAGFEACPQQIVCLEHQDMCLYAEIVQIAETRLTSWLRPVVLHVIEPQPLAAANDYLGSSPTAAAIEGIPTVYDLRQGADLLWPLGLFRLALDTEVIPLLAQLPAVSVKTETQPEAHRQLCRFIQRVWEANPTAFRHHRMGTG